MNSKGASTSMGSNSPRFELIYHYGTIYEGLIDYRFTHMYKGVLIIIQGCTKNSKQVFYIGLID